MNYNYNYNNNTKQSKKNTILSVLLIVLFVGTAVGAIIFANFDPKHDTYSVTFKIDGKEYATYNKIKLGYTVKEPETPTKEGYEFVGWYVGEEKFNFDDTITGDVELTAKWKKEGEADPVNPDPTPTPTPTPTNNSTEKVPDPVIPSKKTGKNYTIKVVNGTGSGTYPEGTVVTITPKVPDSVISEDWTEGTMIEDGQIIKIRYRTQTSYVFKKWSDGDTTQNKKITVTANATYEAKLEEQVTQISRQKWVNNYRMGYPKKIMFEGNHSAGYIVAGNLYSNGDKSVCTPQECVGTIHMVGPDQTETTKNSTATWKWNGVSWKATYNPTTGIVTVSGGTTVSSPVTVKMKISYSDNELGGYVGDAIIPQNGTEVMIGTVSPKGDNYHYEIKSKSGKKTSSEAMKFTIQLPKVIVGSNGIWQTIINN